MRPDDGSQRPCPSNGSVGLSSVCNAICQRFIIRRADYLWWRYSHPHLFWLSKIVALIDSKRHPDQSEFVKPAQNKWYRLLNIQWFQFDILNKCVYLSKTTDNIFLLQRIGETAKKTMGCTVGSRTLQTAECRLQFFLRAHEITILKNGCNPRDTRIGALTDWLFQ